MADEGRLAELIGGLSLATDLAAGVGQETALRTCVIAVALGRELGLTQGDLQDVYYTALLRFVGCTAFAHETAWRYGSGDDMGLLGDLGLADGANPLTIFGQAAKGKRPANFGDRARTLGKLMSDPATGKKLATAHCDLAVAMAQRLGMNASVIEALGQIYERFDGKGSPLGLKGDAIILPARIMQVAWRAEIHRGIEGDAEAVAVVRQRSGAELDPHIAGAFQRRAAELLEQVSQASVWDPFLAAEPSPPRLLADDGISTVAAAFASYVDLKSPFTLRHSTGVADLVTEAARGAGMTPESAEELRNAALLHDIGRVSVPNGIWDKPGPLNAAEWERVRLHPYYSERILNRTPLLASIAEMAGKHHERLDGSGYYRAVRGDAAERSERLLAAAVAYFDKTEERAYRLPHVPERAAALLQDEARAGRLDREAVECVLMAAGQRPSTRLRGELPASLTEREVEVLGLLAMGFSNKTIGERLFISSRTVQHHLEHVYSKTGINNRAAAAVYAVMNGLLER